VSSPKDFTSLPIGGDEKKPSGTKITFPGKRERNNKKEEKKKEK